jgi:uroporphyrinogen-III synthase
MAFDGLRVLAFESRRAEELATLIRKQGGDPFVAPSMREVPLESQEACLAFGRDLLAGHFDGAIFLTGVGTRLLWKALVAHFPEDALKAALSNITRIVRGPKPSAALRELGLAPGVLVPEPNTWREILAVLRDRPERRLALQEYGKASPALVSGLQAMGKSVTPVPIYGWDLPEDTAPLREAVARLAAGQTDVVLFTTSVQAVNLFRIAAAEGVESQVQEALASAFVASIGPTTTETLETFGIRADFEPSHPKMGLLVNECAERASGALANKR